MSRPKPMPTTGYAISSPGVWALTPTEEQHIVDVFPAGGGSTEDTMAGWPIVEPKSPFPQFGKYRLASSTDYARNDGGMGVENQRRRSGVTPLYEVLAGTLIKPRSGEIESDIPNAWYNFNTRYGDTTVTRPE
ncbi:hypothetical protein B0H13DRAFT_2278999 [Mycena leptocephala]|nr:hypothetical protein B0H13DRAFT_2278999 [Mycena leptocephala]